MTNEIEKNISPTEEQVKEWESKYGKLKRVTVKDPDTGEELRFYFKKIDLRVLRLATNAISQEKDAIKYAEIVLKNTIINGADYLNDSEIFLALVPMVDKLLSAKIAQLEKN